MGLSYEQAVQERIASALERIEALLIEQKQAKQDQPTPKRRGRPPKERNAEDVRS